jgi:hypothetical protein
LHALRFWFLFSRVIGSRAAQLGIVKFFFCGWVSLWGGGGGAVVGEIITLNNTYLQYSYNVDRR